jgi:hypothetical protein
MWPEFALLSIQVADVAKDPVSHWIGGQRQLNHSWPITNIVLDRSPRCPAASHD